MTQTDHYARVLTVIATLIATAAMAQTPGAAGTPPQEAAAVSPFQSAAVATADLGRIAGREDIAQSINAENTATVSRNSVSGNSVTGTIAFDAQSFQNMNGLSVLSANTGNNVAINSSLNVNVTLHP